MKDSLNKIYGSVFEEQLLVEIDKVALIKDFKDGDVIIDFGDSIKKMPLLLSVMCRCFPCLNMQALVLFQWLRITQIRCMS